MYTESKCLGTTAGDLVNSVYTIVVDVLGRFVKSTQAGVTRAVAGLRYIPENKDAESAEAQTPPFLAIQASGPSFESPVPSNNSFANIASYIAVRLESEMECLKEIVKDMEPFARRIFDEQSNRLFVRSLVITEKHAQLIHFDRAGVEVTPLIDIHTHPATLVRFVAGLATEDERLLGFDRSIQWTIVNGRKDKGTVTTIGPTGEARTYPILEKIPIAWNGIVGRGTNCWRVQDPDTLEEFVIKDSWRPDDTPPEHDLLKLVDGLPGVVQMVSYEPERGETNDFRCPSNAGKCHNRAASRTTMKSYGKSIDFFTSVPQVLCAIRDAIAGHQRLLSDGLRILHRDISHNNILIGPEGAPEGYRGILIDLDIAFMATDECPTVATDYNIGTRMFQSLLVLSSYVPRDKVIAHDYLDDLESFLFVLVYTFLIHNPDGSRVSSKEVGPSLVGRWDHADPRVAWRRKEAMLGGAEVGMTFRIIKDTWGAECVELYRRFTYALTDMREDKLEILEERRRQKRPTTTDPLEKLYSQRDKHYAKIIALFNEAIDALKASVPTTVPDSHAVPNPTPPTTKPLTTSPLHSAEPLPLPGPLLASPPATVIPGSTSPVQPVTRCHLASSAASAGPRRSTRLKKLSNSKCASAQGSVLGADAPVLQSTVLPTSAPPPQVRRSAHVLKRRLEAEQSDLPPTKTRRLKKGPRTTARAR